MSLKENTASLKLPFRHPFAKGSPTLVGTKQPVHCFIGLVTVQIVCHLWQSVPVAAQTQPHCTRCRIVLTPALRLGERNPDHTLLNNTQVARDSRGNLYVGPVNSAYEVYMFNSRGEAVRRIGRRGRGPGEFQNVYRLLIGRADSLLVLDQDHRLQVFEVTGHVARTVQLPILPHALRMLGDGRLLAQGAIANRAHVGNPLFILDVDGTVIRSFGGAGARTRLDDFTSGLRGIALSADGTILSSAPNRYGVERWDTTGHRLVAATAEAPSWFAEWSGDPPPVNVERPRPYQGPPMEFEGVLWTGYSVADENWHQGRTTRPSEQERRLTLAERDRYVDMLLEARDARTGVLLATHRVDHGAIMFLGSGWVYWKYQRDDGLIVIDVMRATVVQQ